MMHDTHIFLHRSLFILSPCLDHLSQLPEVLLETCCEVSALARSEKKVGGKKKSLLEGSDRFRGEGCGELAAEEAAAWSR